MHLQQKISFFYKEAKATGLCVDHETGESWHVCCHLAMVTLLFLSEKQRKEPDPRRVIATGVVGRGKERKKGCSSCQDRCPKIESLGAQL